jgi:predicted AAA+ superfamily ATPase
MPRLLALLAARAGALLNKAAISRDAQIAYAPLDRYLALLEKTFLVQLVSAWSGNLGKRLTKAPKVALCDVGLAAHLQGITAARLARDPHLAGPLLENFVAMELAKQASWAPGPITLFHFRTSAGREVDLVLEDGAGRVVAVEVKAAASFGTKDVSGLRALADDLGARFHRGVLLYTGEAVVPIGPRLWALPVDALWRWSATERVQSAGSGGERSAHADLGKAREILSRPL